MSLTDDIRSGSSDAIKQLYQENAQEIYDFAKSITNNHDTAMQATKNTLSRLVQEIQDGKEPANIHSEALKLAYDEACKIAMPTVQNVKSPYDEEVPVKETRTVRQENVRQESARRTEQYSDDYEEDYDRQRSSQSKGNRQEYSRQSAQRRSRDDDYDRYDRYDDRYDRYDDRYDDDYDDYDDYEEKKGHGAGFYICLVINIILVLILIWFLIGLLVNLGVLPDSLNMLGYNWFNETIYPLF